jgi:hypothetical protein
MVQELKSRRAQEPESGVQKLKSRRAQEFKSGEVQKSSLSLLNL